MAMTDGDSADRVDESRVQALADRFLSLADSIANLLWDLCIVLGAVLVAIIAFQVFSRYVLGWVPLWGGELSRYLAIWIALLLTPVFIWQDRHLQVEIFFRKLPRRWQPTVRKIQLVVLFVVGYLIADWGLVYAINNGVGQTSPSMDFQMFWVYLIIPISGALIMVLSVAKLLEIQRDPDTVEKDYRSRFLVDDDGETEEGA
jgi:TRAP-type C4-dicarboxylate transport system permease small subunit